MKQITLLVTIPVIILIRVTKAHVIVIKHDIATGMGFPAFQFGQNSTNGNKIRLINHWGTGKWQSMKNAFHNVNLVKWTNQDIPDFSKVTSFHGMFKDNLSIGAINTFNWTIIDGGDCDFIFANRFE